LKAGNFEIGSIAVGRLNNRQLYKACRSYHQTYYDSAN